MITAILLAGLAVTQASQGLGFAEALTRAERYENDPKAQIYRLEKLNPMLTPKVRTLFARCEVGMTQSQRFTLVVSFRGGRFDRVESNDDGAVARCMSEGFSVMPYPAPPYDDFAEEMRMELDGQGR